MGVVSPAFYPRSTLAANTYAAALLMLAALLLTHAPASRAAAPLPAHAGTPVVLDCRVVAQSSTEVLLQCHFDWPAIAAAAEADRLLPALGFVAVPRGASASLEIVPGQCAGLASKTLLLSAPYSLRGIDVVGLALDLDLAAARGSGALAEDVSIRVRFAGGTSEFGDPRLRSRLWEPLIERLVLNHESLPLLDAAPAGARSQGCEYIIICPDDPPFTEWAENLRAWRTLQGITTQVFTTAEIGATWQEIKQFLVDAYNTWTVPPAAFLLLGDYPNSGEGRYPGIPAPIYNSYAVSDNLYADVDGDGLPEMIPGRITARQAVDLANMVGKLLAHEATPSLNPSFYAHPVLATGWEPDGRTVMELETLYGFQVNILGQEPAREYVAVSPGSEWPDPQWVATFGPAGYGYLPPTPEYLTDWGGSAARINADINAGAYLVLHRGSAAETSWGDPTYTVNDVAGLHNTSYPFVLSMDCLTGKFNSATMCLTEALHRSAHGALGMISASEVCYSLPTTRLMLYLVDTLWPTFLSTGPGSDLELRPAWALAAAKYLLSLDATVSPQQKLTTYHLYHHHGDPFLVMNSEVPQPLSVTHEDYCLVGASTFTVQADAGALIGLTVEGVLVGAGVGTGAPVAIPIMPPVQEGVLRVTVTQQNRLRYDVCVPIRDASAVPGSWPSLPTHVQLILMGANPSVSAAQFRYALPPAVAGTRVTLSIHDITGRSVRTLIDAPQGAGVHESLWSGTDDLGSPLGAGIYFARLTCGDESVALRFVRIQ